jgi:tetratricopeptide (TPR) repeat protein
LLSDAYSRRVRFLGQESDLQLALSAFSQARALEPNLLDVELAWVVYLYHGLDEFEQALQALENLGTRADGDARAVELKGYLYRRLGRYPEAYRELATAQTLDPKNTSRVDDLVNLAIWIGDCDAAEQHASDALDMAPNDASAVFAFVDYELECRDNYDRSRALAGSVDLTPVYHVWSARLLAFFSHDLQRMLELALMDPEPPDTYDWLFNLSHRAWVLRYVGRTEEAEQVLDEMADALDGRSETGAWSDDPDYAALMMELASMRGDKAATLRWFDTFIALRFPADKFDHWTFAASAPYWAWSFVDTGLYDEAVALLGEMLERPGGHTWRYIDAMPCFEVLDDHPGFQELRGVYGN